jgi:hypothetical protein
MRRTKHRICLGCSQPFIGRVDAKTCSAKCRKRFQRAQALYRAVVEQPDISAVVERQAAYGLKKTSRSYYAR